MSDLIAEYREHAAFCESMAATADTPEVRAGWLRLAEKWLSMIPQPAEGSGEAPKRGAPPEKRHASR